MFSNDRRVVRSSYLSIKIIILLYLKLQNIQKKPRFGTVWQMNVLNENLPVCPAQGDLFLHFYKNTFCKLKNFHPVKAT